MVVMYVQGTRVGTLPENPDLLAKYIEQGTAVELRSDTGRPLGQFLPNAACPWEPDLTEEEIVRRIQEPGSSTLEEFWSRMGVQ